MSKSVKYATILMPHTNINEAAWSCLLITVRFYNTDAAFQISQDKSQLFIGLILWPRQIAGPWNYARANNYACFYRWEIDLGGKSKAFLSFFPLSPPKSHKVAEVEFCPRHVWPQTHTAFNKLGSVTQETRKDVRTLQIIEKIWKIRFITW